MGTQIKGKTHKGALMKEGTRIGTLMNGGLMGTLIKGGL